MNDLYRKLYKAIKRHSGMSKAEIIEAGKYGADAGWVGFTYTGDAVKFYNKNEDAIYELLNETAEAHGYKNPDELVSTFKRSDMLFAPDTRKNLLAWFVLEEVGSWLSDKERVNND